MLGPLQPLLHADHSLFHRINGVWTAGWLDAAMPFVTDLHKQAAVRFGVFPAALAAWVYRRRGVALRAILAATLAVSLADLTAYRIVKPLAHRPRPEAPEAIRRTPASGFGFPSNHAANLSAAAEAAGAIEPPLRLPLWLLALIVGYSRIYVGAHYPLDVLGGFAVGILISRALVLAFSKVRKQPPRFTAHAR